MNKIELTNLTEGKKISIELKSKLGRSKQNVFFFQETKPRNYIGNTCKEG